MSVGAGGADLERSAGVLHVNLPDGQAAEIGYEVLKARHRTKESPWVVLVPGSGAPSRRGEQSGDGVISYSAEVHVHTQWASALAGAGYPVFAFDKRTCHPRHRPLCRANPSTDMDREGPGALARDVDAACAWIRAQQGANTKVILFAHGQGLSPVLQSACARDAAGLVGLSPIPRRIDRVLVHALEHRQERMEQEAEITQNAERRAQLETVSAGLRNQAATLHETFVSMNRGDFAPDARIRGSTLAYWRGWIRDTAQAQSRIKSLRIPKLFLLGAEDRQYGPEDQTLIRRFSRLPATSVQEVPGADHHLLQDEKLSSYAVNAVLHWLLQREDAPDA